MWGRQSWRRAGFQAGFNLLSYQLPCPAHTSLRRARDIGDMTSKLILAVTAIAALYAQTLDRTGAITFLVIDESGRSLPGWKVTSFSSGSRDAASMFKGLTATQVPTGFYQYVLSGPTVSRQLAPDWTPTLGGKVEVNRPESFVVKTATGDILSGGAIDRMLPLNFVIRGRIEPAPADSQNSEPLRINIHPLNPWSDIDVPVDSNGEFRIFTAPRGICAVTVIRGTEVSHIQAISFDQDFHPTSFVLKLGEPATALLHVK
jgi:hypothetical protein